MVTLSFIFNLRADIAEACALACDADCPLQRILRDGQQLVDTLLNDSHRHRCRRVPHPTVLDHADVQLHNIAVLNPALARDPVYNFVIERNANVPRKNAVPQPITQESASHLRFLHESSSRVIDLFGRNSGTDELADTIENFARGAARLAHLLDFFCAFDRNHAGTLSSITCEISANTPSRSRLPSIRCKIDILP